MSTCENVKEDGIVFQFDINNGNTGVMNISNVLLDSHDKAEEASMAAFLHNSFAINPVDFSTYITNHFLNKVIKVGGLNYLIKSIDTSGNDTLISVNIRGERYDD